MLVKRIKKKKYEKKILTKEGSFLAFIDDKKKCYCHSGRIYKNCCKEDDIIGDFDHKADIFYCDIESYIKFYTNLDQKNEEIENKNKPKKEREKEMNGNNISNGNNSVTEVKEIDKKLAMIFI